MSDHVPMSHDDICVAIGCLKHANTYWVFYDHRDCMLTRGEVLLTPVCERHAKAVGNNMTEAHFQCMGWDAPASLISGLFESWFGMEEVNP